MAAAVMDRVSAALGAGQFDAVAGVLDEAELCSPSANVLDNGWPAAMHLLAHIYNGNHADARMLYKRLPNGVKAQPEVEAAWRLLQLMWQGSGEGAWRALRAYPWSGALATLVEALYDKLRNQQLKLVEAAYSTIAPARLAALCGCGEEEALALAQAKGWRAAAGGAEGQPAVVEVVPARGVRGELDSLECLVHLSEYMMQLEEPV